MKQNDAKLHVEKESLTQDSMTNGRKHSISNGVKVKSKRINKCDLGPNFVPPDGGWGWIVLAAAGCSNVSSNVNF